MSVVWIWSTGLAFAIIHSALATQYCKNIFYRLGMNPKSYRLAYSILATLLTVLWLGFVHQLPDTTLYRTHGWMNGLMTVVQLAGLGIVVLSLRAIDTSSFLGLSTGPEKQDSFTEHGIYRYVRHPMYSGVMLALLASPVQTVNSLNLFAIIILYFIIGSRFEEQRMQTIHPEYADYQRRVSAFIPRPRAGRAHE
ncbi:MAG: isoprenylcysteine carboxylmethyltransferase family protein [Mariprofundaceae bacterium]|nr:isoprenylcysteine carboxylmethyltransferase family protein [Mariprofundaceae bacterium]